MPRAAANPNGQWPNEGIFRPTMPIRTNDDRTLGEGAFRELALWFLYKGLSAAVLVSVLKPPLGIE